MMLPPWELERMLGPDLHAQANTMARTFNYGGVPDAIMACALRLVSDSLAGHRQSSVHPYETPDYRRVTVIRGPAVRSVPQDEALLEHTASCTYDRSTGPEGDYCTCGLRDGSRKRI